MNKRITDSLTRIYPTQQLSQFLDSYTFVHWNATIWVIRYLKGTRTLCLTLGGNNKIRLAGYTDSDWANCLDTWRSIGSYCNSLGSGLVSWNTKKQKTVAASSCEAEYVAAFKSAKEIVWLHSLLLRINFPQSEATTINCDNNFIGRPLPPFTSQAHWYKISFLTRTHTHKRNNSVLC